MIFTKFNLSLKGLVHKLIAILFIPLLIIIKLIKPIYKIRLREFMSERIGHFVGDAGISLCDQVYKEEYKDLCWFITPSCNSQIEKMVKRVFFVRWWVRYLIIANSFFPSLNLAPFENRWAQARDVRGLYFKTKDLKEAYLPFSNEEEEQAKNFLKNLGVKRTDKFVCLIIRDAEYLKTHYPNEDWSYHDYRDSSINSYIESIEALKDLGYWIFRMGKEVKEKLDYDHPRVIDYANSDERSDLLDVWLPANSHFSISTSTGLDAVPQAFRRPVVYVNAMTNADFRSHDHCIWAPKDLYWKGSKENSLTLKETLINNFSDGRRYEDLGINITNLSPDLIKDIVLEMHKRLSGEWEISKQEELNQEKFIKIISAWPEKEKMHGFFHPKALISQTYLEHNSSFLSELFDES